MTSPGSDKSVRPATIDELAAALRDTDGPVAVRGGGTRSDWGGAGVQPDLVIDMTGMSGVVEHAAGDLVVTVEAGAPLADLQGIVGAHRQWLALDPPDGGTIGGLLATADSGPRRLRFGTPRELVLGMTVVLADGTVARSGGKVVKNVAGYDLGKLFTGSFGSLGVIAQATLRLHPTLVARRVVSVTVARPWNLVREVLRSPAMPTAIEWYDGTLHVVVESSEAAVDAQADTVAALIDGDVSRDLPPDFVGRPRTDGDMLLKLTFRLSALDDVVDGVRRVDGGALPRAHAGSGVLWVSTQPDSATVNKLRDLVAPYEGSVVVARAPEELKAAVDVWGPVRGLEVMRRIKAQFDPNGRMNPGRFVGGI